MTRSDSPAGRSGMSCRELSGRLTAYLDGELDALNASAVRGHLRTCDACRAAAEDHAAIRDHLAELDRPDPPPAMWDGIMARLGEAEIADARRSRWARFNRWAIDRIRPHLAPAAIAVGACAVAALIIQLRRGPDGAGAPVAVAPPAPVLVDRAPPAPVPVVPDRDASAELADEEARIDARFRDVAADLLEMARAEVGGGAAGRRFERRVAAMEAEILAADGGAARDRAWHQLLGFLERASLGERVAELGRAGRR